MPCRSWQGVSVVATEAVKPRSVDGPLLSVRMYVECDYFAVCVFIVVSVDRPLDDHFVDRWLLEAP